MQSELDQMSETELLYEFLHVLLRPGMVLTESDQQDIDQITAAMVKRQVMGRA